MADLSDEINIFMRVLELIGAFAGAISGVRLASVKRFDWFGASVIGFITAAGGGTLRDVLLRVEPFWMSDSSYIIVICPLMKRRPKSPIDTTARADTMM